MTDLQAMVPVPCDLCGSDDHFLLFDKEGFRHVRCRACGLVFVSPRLRHHLDFQVCSGTGSMGDEQITAGQRRRVRKELRALEPFRKLNRFLEIGPGRGWFLAEAAQTGWETWAVEVNRDALERLAAQGNHRIIAQSAEAFEVPESTVDVVRMWDVIEHLESPRRALTAVSRALRPGGVLRLATTNFASLSRWINGPDWVYLNGADHIVLFEPKTMTRLLEACGFDEITIRTRSFNLRRKRYHPEQELVSPYKLLWVLRKVIDESVRFTRFGHQMIVTAVRGAAE